MTITKNSLIMMIFFLTIKRSLAQSANSQQPTANSQQPTANSQQVNFNQNNILFYVNKFIIEKSSLGISLRFVRIANYPMTALFLCLGRLCFAGGASYVVTEPVEVSTCIQQFDSIFWSLSYVEMYQSCRTNSRSSLPRNETICCSLRRLVSLSN